MTGDIIQMLYSAAILGSAYAMMGSGLTVIWGGLRFPNLAHGALYAFGGFAAYWLIASHGLPTVVGLLVGFAATAAAGVALHLGLYRHLLKKPTGESSTLVAGLGVAIAMQAWLTIESPRDKALPPLVGGSFTLPGGATATGAGAFVIVFSVVILGALGLFLARSWLGIQVRAVADNRAGAELIGIRTEWIFTLVMAVSAGLAGLAGVMLGSIYFVSASGGFTALLMALIVTIIGGLGSFSGTIVAAYVVGVVESSTTFWLGSQWVLPLLFGGLMLFLVARPQGIAGKLTFDPGQ